MRFFCYFSFLLILGSFSPLQASPQADDGEVAIAPEGINFKNSKSIILENEHLFISVGSIRVNIGFKNASDQDYTTLVSFPYPAYPPYLEAACEAGANTSCSKAERVKSFLKKFNVSANGVSFKPKSVIKAFADKKDITPMLKNYDVDFEDEEDSVKFIRKLPLPAVNEMIRRGAIDVGGVKGLQLTKDNFAEFQKTKGLKLEIKWELRQKYYWDQNFVAGQVTQLAYEFPPLYGHSSKDSTKLSNAETAEYCVKDKDYKKELEQWSTKDKLAHVQVKTLNYNLTSANAWAGSIGAFELEIETETPNTFISTCLPGIQKLGPQSYKLNLKNFSPKKDLKIIFVTPI